MMMIVGPERFCFSSLVFDLKKGGGDKMNRKSDSSMDFRWIWLDRWRTRYVGIYAYIH